jgi:hypothetical protein
MAYELRVEIDTYKGVIGISFLLVSSTCNPKIISDEIQQFVGNFFGNIDQDLGGANNSKFTRLKESVFTSVGQFDGVNLSFFFDFIVEEIRESKNYFLRKEPV